MPVIGAAHLGRSQANPLNRRPAGRRWTASPTKYVRKWNALFTDRGRPDVAAWLPPISSAIPDCVLCARPWPFEYGGTGLYLHW